jgi:hypothetical protein
MSLVVIVRVAFARVVSGGGGWGDGGRGGHDRRSGEESTDASRDDGETHPGV